jgi:hypothetical protein
MPRMPEAKARLRSGMLVFSSVFEALDTAMMSATSTIMRRFAVHAPYHRQWGAHQGGSHGDKIRMHSLARTILEDVQCHACALGCI